MAEVMASDAVRVVRALERECEEWKNQALATRAELAEARKTILDLEQNRKNLFDSIGRLEGQLRGYKAKVQEISGITYDQLRTQFHAVLTKHLDGVMDDIKQKLAEP